METVSKKIAIWKENTKSTVWSLLSVSANVLKKTYEKRCRWDGHRKESVMIDYPNWWTGNRMVIIEEVTLKRREEIIWGGSRNMEKENEKNVLL